MRLFLLFLIVPLIEIALFVQIGGAIGLGWTLAIVVITAVIGTILVRSQGIAVLNRLRGSLDKYHDPTEPLVHGAMILFSGALLLTPGFFTDAVGFALLVSPVRSFLFERLRYNIRIRTAQGGPAPQQPDVIDGEYQEVDPDSAAQRPSGWTRH
ncbi:MAG: FxsA family protein [Woeseia sp.]|nr:FxsA family protein [Woeseia sp.]